MTTALLIIAVLMLAYSNGANDNFKGVATLYGSRTTTFRGALIWATAATVLGSLLSVWLAQGLVVAFSGKGLIPNDLISPAMLLAVGGGAAITIFAATLLGMPTSTTHALTGALVGAGLVANAGAVGWTTLATKFAQPLLLSPLLAIGLTAVLYMIFRRIRLAMDVERQTCVCIGKLAPQPVAVQPDGTAVLASSLSDGPTIGIAKTDQCIERYAGRCVGINAQVAVDTVHYLSAGAVCFARAVNDTPKIAALLLAAGIGLGGAMSAGTLLMVSAAVAIGGLIQARKVAETMSKRITDLNPGQGLTANLMTALLVLVASRLGLPVSTTHVSCGSIFGIGLVNRKRRWGTIGKILATWVTTLPLGLGLGALLYAITQSFGSVS